MHVCSAWRALQVNQALAAVLLERVKPDRGVCRFDGGGVESYPPIRFVCADSLGHIQGHEKHSLHPHSPLRAEIHQPCVGGVGSHRTCKPRAFQVHDICRSSGNGSRNHSHKPANILHTFVGSMVELLERPQKPLGCSRIESIYLLFRVG